MSCLLAFFFGTFCALLSGLRKALWDCLLAAFFTAPPLPLFSKRGCPFSLRSMALRRSFPAALPYVRPDFFSLPLNFLRHLELKLSKTGVSHISRLATRDSWPEPAAERRRSRLSRSQANVIVGRQHPVAAGDCPPCDADSYQSPRPSPRSTTSFGECLLQHPLRVPDRRPTDPGPLTAEIFLRTPDSPLVASIFFVFKCSG